MWCSSAAEAHRMIDAIKEANVPIFAPHHGTRFWRTLERQLHHRGKLRAGGAGGFFHGYGMCPKSGCWCLKQPWPFYGLSPEDALAMITIEPAKMLGIEDRVGSIEPGKDADLAFFDGDPFEWVTHCEGVMIDGQSFEQEQQRSRLVIGSVPVDKARNALSMGVDGVYPTASDRA